MEVHDDWLSFLKRQNWSAGSGSLKSDLSILKAPSAFQLMIFAVPDDSCLNPEFH